MSEGQNKEHIPRVGSGNDQRFLFLLVREEGRYDVRTSTLERGTTEVVVDPSTLRDLLVEIYSPSTGASFQPPWKIEDNHISVDLEAKNTECIYGVLRLRVSFSEEDPGYQDRLRKTTKEIDLCTIVPTRLASYNHTISYTFRLDPAVALIVKGEKGDRGEQGIQGIQGIQGEQGLRGERGEQGIQGVQGERGAQGERGLQGDRGLQGVKGDKGDEGKSAYQSYLETTSDTPKLTEQQWADSLKGGEAKLAESKRYTDETIKTAREETHQEIGIVRELAYKKSRRFLSALPPSEYKEGDEWVITADWTTYKRGTALIAVKDSRAGIYSPDDWAELYKYAQMIEEAKRWNVHTHTFDLTQLDPNKYYAAVIHLPSVGVIGYEKPARFDIALFAGLDRSIPVPPYATHSMGFHAELRWSVSSSSWGVRQENRIITGYTTKFVKQGEEVMSAPAQRTEVSAEYVYLRGGGRYIAEVKSDYKPTFALAASNWSAKGDGGYLIYSPVDSVTPPKTDVERLRDDMREGDKAALEGAKNAATAKAREVISDLQLGGRNYAKGTAGVKEGSDSYMAEYRVSAPWVAGVDYMVSFTLGSEYPDMLVLPHVDGWSNSDGVIRAEGTPTHGADGLYYARYSGTIRTTQESIDLSVKRIAGGNGGFRLYKTRRVGASDKGRYSLSRVMLERGNKPSDWSPAPEDTEEAIAALVQRVAALEGAKQS